MSFFDTIKHLRKVSFSSRLNTIIVFGKIHVFPSKWWVYAYLLNIPLNYLFFECSRAVVSDYGVHYLVNLISTIILGMITSLRINKLVSKTEKEQHLFFSNELASLVLIWFICYLIYLIVSLTIIYCFFHPIRLADFPGL